MYFCKRTFLLVSLIVLVLWTFGMSFDIQGDMTFTQEELQWMEANKKHDFHIGLAPYEGIDLFKNGQVDAGYIFNLESLFEKETGLKFTVDTDKPWGEAYEGLQDGGVDILFGANPTEERLKFMAFTEPILEYPYVVISKKGAKMYTIGDLNQRTVGFIDGDQIIPMFSDIYYNIQHDTQTYDDPNLGIQGLLSGEIDGFITAKTEIIEDYLFNNQSLEIIGELKNASSDMTFSTLIDNHILVGIISKILDENSDEIKEMIRQAQVTFFRQVIHLTDSEKKWLATNPSMIAGITADYLPIDYMNEVGQYSGVAGNFLTKVTEKIGINLIPVEASFDQLYKMALSGEVDTINLAKTEDRLPLFMFTDAFSEERDVIFGLKDESPVYDIYNLDGKTVAVIEDYWHLEYLQKNLRDVNIVITKDISESIRIVSEGKADYFIENPLVANYYIEGLGYKNIIIKGETSSDSYLYFGVRKDLTDFVTIFNKAKKLVDYDEAIYEGLRDVPELRNIENRKLTIIIVVIGIGLLAVVVVLLMLYGAFLKQQSETKLLKEREHLMYTDALTDLYNRLYFNALEPKMNDRPMPQSFIMMDLNYLKTTNDTHGHFAGDQLLIKFADILKEHFPHEAIMRMGGDEFFVFLEGTDDAATIKEIELIKEACQLSVVDIGKGKIISGPVTSFGYVIRQSLSEDPSDMLHLADMAMYNEKMRDR